MLHISNGSSDINPRQTEDWWKLQMGNVFKFNFLWSREGAEEKKLIQINRYAKEICCPSSMILVVTAASQVTLKQSNLKWPLWFAYNFFWSEIWEGPCYSGSVMWAQSNVTKLEAWQAAHAKCRQKGHTDLTAQEACKAVQTQRPESPQRRVWN